MAVGGKKGVKAEINVTPLVDVVLVLLIIFMVITPMLQRGKDVTLPKTQSVSENKATEDAEPLILSVTADKRMFFDKFEYDEENLQTKLEDELRRAPGRKILLKGDVGVNVGAVRKVMDIARKAGARGVALAVEQIKDQ